jgi:hypothetical protein
MYHVSYLIYMIKNRYATTTIKISNAVIVVIHNALLLRQIIIEIVNNIECNKIPAAYGQPFSSDVVMSYFRVLDPVNL